jgi:hypothetical protein
MSYEDRKNEFSEMLEYLAESLDISESRFKEAEGRYQAVGKWLERDESVVAEFDPAIYTQGSFRLGTVIKPFTDEEKYDIDLVCQLSLTKKQATQKQLKDLVGFEIKAYALANNMKYPAEESRRCWTLNYAEGTQFHMDTLPCIPDSEAFKLILQSRSIPGNITEHAIAITDNTLPNYGYLDEDWLRSNPKGYAEWFKERMKIQFETRRMILAESIEAKAEDVPDYKVKTTLQRAVQLFKRHRDIMFKNDPGDKPISMIITTLAAHAYHNEDDLYDALDSIINGMPDYILTKDGAPWIPNPVNPDENFADKWKEKLKKELNFRKWLLRVETDLASAFKESGIHKVAERLKPAFGDRAVNQAMKRMGDDFRLKRESGFLKMTAGTGILGETGSTPVKKHTFYGK